MFTIAERRALDQLSTRQGHLAILAADQRTKLVAARTAAGLPHDLESLREFKLDLVEALAPLAPAVLLDPEIALPHVLEQRAFPARTTSWSACMVSSIGVWESQRWIWYRSM